MTREDIQRITGDPSDDISGWQIVFAYGVSAIVTVSLLSIAALLLEGGWWLIKWGLR